MEAGGIFFTSLKKVLSPNKNEKVKNSPTAALFRIAGEPDALVTAFASDANPKIPSV
jgi:hypothetical protein